MCQEDFRARGGTEPKQVRILWGIPRQKSIRLIYRSDAQSGRKTAALKSVSFAWLLVGRGRYRNNPRFAVLELLQDGGSYSLTMRIQPVLGLMMSLCDIGRALNRAHCRCSS